MSCSLNSYEPSYVQASPSSTTERDQHAVSRAQNPGLPPVQHCYTFTVIHYALLPLHAPL